MRVPLPYPQWINPCSKLAPCTRASDLHSLKALVVKSAIRVVVMVQRDRGCTGLISTLLTSPKYYDGNGVSQPFCCGSSGMPPTPKSPNPFFVFCRLRESSNINQSLLTLGTVINALSGMADPGDGDDDSRPPSPGGGMEKKTVLVPYRNRSAGVLPLAAHVSTALSTPLTCRSPRASFLSPQRLDVATERVARR